MILVRFQSHEFDECRFDVAVNNCVWYLRADHPEDRANWIEVLQSYKPPVDAARSDALTTSALKRHGSTQSLQSNSLSTASTNSITVSHRNLREKLNEIDTFRDILFGQINTLQRYYVVIYYLYLVMRAVHASCSAHSAIYTLTVAR